MYMKLQIYLYNFQLSIFFGADPYCNYKVYHRCVFIIICGIYNFISIKKSQKNSPPVYLAPAVIYYYERVMKYIYVYIFYYIYLNYKYYRLQIYMYKNLHMIYESYKYYIIIYVATYNIYIYMSHMMLLYIIYMYVPSHPCGTCTCSIYMYTPVPIIYMCVYILVLVYYLLYTRCTCTTHLWNACIMHTEVNY